MNFLSGLDSTINSALGQVNQAGGGDLGQISGFANQLGDFSKQFKDMSSTFTANAGQEGSSAVGQMVQQVGGELMQSFTSGKQVNILDTVKRIGMQCLQNMFRKYQKGWPSSKPRDNPYPSTVRDIGFGSAENHDFRSLDNSTTERPVLTYEKVRNDCLSRGALWEDPEFLADDSSIYFQNPPSCWPGIRWLRPHEICGDPQMFAEGASRMDINQGVLGDCWLLAAVACLACRPKLLNRVVPEDQNFTDNYAGVFRFELWQYGRWVEVMVDDRLPTSGGKLIYMHSDSRNEFWTALLEKAYAKLNGTYEALTGGLTSEALTDFTGGLVYRANLRDETPSDLFNVLYKANQRGALMACSIDATADTMEARLDNGLIIGHAYSITDCKLVTVQTPTRSGQIGMVRVRNPWGDEHEWKGAWSDRSPEWNYISESEKQTIGLTFEHDGEFWMSYDDFKDEYQRLEVCYLGPDTLADEDSGAFSSRIKKWEGRLQEGSWRKFVNAGGCRNFPKTFWTNPQYRVTIPEPDEDSENGLGMIIVALMQKDRRKLRSEGKDCLTAGYAIYQLDDPGVGTLQCNYFLTHKSAARSPAFINLREISAYHHLAPGHYVIIPSTFEPNEEADFILRVFSEKKDDLAEIDDETAITDPTAEDLGGDEPGDVELEEAAKELFESMKGDSGEVDAFDLKEILNKTLTNAVKFDGFSIDLCRSMVAMKDADLSGRLDDRDFAALWEDLKLCKKAFRTKESEAEGFFDAYEFRNVLNTLGLRLSNATFNAIVMRYSNKDGHVHFNDFVACVVKLKTLFQTFKTKDVKEEGHVKFVMDEFIQMTMYS